MTLTKQHVADEFLAAARTAGLKKVMVFVGKVTCNEFVVTMMLSNPEAVCDDDELLVISSPYEFKNAAHLQHIAADKARRFAEALPTIH